KTILLPTDFSENAFNAIKYAVAMYRDESCEFLLLHAYNVNNYVEGSTFEAAPIEDKLEEAKEKSESRLNDLKNFLTSSNGNGIHKFLATAKNKSIIDAIQEEIKAKNV